MHLVLVVAKSGLGDRADVTLLAVCCRRVVWRKDGGDSADDGAYTFVKGLVLGLTYDVLESRARSSIAGVSRAVANARVLREVVVVVSRGIGDRADETRRIHIEVGVRWWQNV